MDRWLDDRNVLDDIDELDYMYCTAPVAVYNEEPPPHIPIHEDAKLETQYSEGSEDESEDNSSGPAYATITEQLRQVAGSVDWANYKFEDTKNVGTEEEEEEEEEIKEEVVLTKSSGLNPEVIEFVPKHMQKGNDAEMPKYIKGQIGLLKKAMKDTFSQNELNPKQDPEKGGPSEQKNEQEKCDNLGELQENKDNNTYDKLKQPKQPQPSKLLKTRNMAITSLLRLRALEKDTLKNMNKFTSMNTLLKPDDFLTPPSASVVSPLVAPLVYNPATEPEVSPSPSAQNTVREMNGSPSTSVSKASRERNGSSPLSVTAAAAVTETCGSPLPSIFEALKETNESPLPSVSKATTEADVSPSQSVYKTVTETNGSPSQSVYKTVTETNVSPSQSAYKTVTETNVSPSQSVYKTVTETNGSSSSSPSICKPVINTKSPSTSARDVVSPKTASPKRTIAKEIPLVIREYVVPELQPKLEPVPTAKPKKTKKCTEFVSSAKTALYYDKYSTLKQELELEKAAGQTTVNTINALIEVKLKEYKQAEGRAETSSCKTKS